MDQLSGSKVSKRERGIAGIGTAFAKRGGALSSRVYGLIKAHA